ncbi:hypothetical protein BDA96_04G184500 [Sorghum bicolor]|uniref:Uncharacterized protein n=1 Tax=Sorghum bicolor TaxID=4558 RepID=A0A921R3J2_SORBI|nr:hypothetical protein BDA96_04G184500 [Sorghum bicolor]
MGRADGSDNRYLYSPSWRCCDSRHSCTACLLDWCVEPASVLQCTTVAWSNKNRSPF